MSGFGRHSFSRDKGKVGNSTYIKSVRLVFFYHLGTAAFGESWQSLPARCIQFITNNYPLLFACCIATGSLIIAIIKTLQAIINYIQKKAAKSRLRIAVVMLQVLKCLMWCLEKCVRLFCSVVSFIYILSHLSSFVRH